jgi:hypothetical protein
MSQDEVEEFHAAYFRSESAPLYPLGLGKKEA